MKKTNLFNLFPDFVAVQRASFCWFLDKGLSEEFNLFSSIIDFSQSYEIQIFGQNYRIAPPKYSSLQAKQFKRTYSIKLYVPIKILEFTDNEIKLKKHEKIFISELPLMTNMATFIINGCERIIVNQIIRGTGIYFTKEKRKREKRFSIKGKWKIIQETFDVQIATIIPKYGVWIKFELDEQNILRCQIDEDKDNNISISKFFTVINTQPRQILGSIKHKKILQDILTKTEKRFSDKPELSKLTLQKVPISKLSKFVQLSSLELDSSKLKNLNLPIEYNNEFDSSFSYSGFELQYEEEEKDYTSLSPSKLNELRNLFLSKNYDLGKIGRLKLNKKFGLKYPRNIQNLTEKDICSILDYLIELKFYDARTDDIDSLKNRRIRGIGEWLQIQFRIGLSRLEKSITNRLSNSFELIESPNLLLNPKPVNSSLKEFFSSSQLSQFMDQINPLSSITHKRRVSSLGPGGLNRDRVIFSARDIHPTHYGRLCPIETPEGKNAGLVLSLATFARVNVDGFIETPFYQVKNGEIEFNKSILYLNAEEEEGFKIVSSDVKIDSKNRIINKIVTIKYDETFTDSPLNNVDLMGISPVQVISPATALIPFIEHDDANRALMGSNMQRQAVPLIKPNPANVGTGLELKMASNSGMLIISYTSGIVTEIESNKIVILTKNNIEVTYHLQKYQRSNQETSINQKPIVFIGETIEIGQVIADGPGSANGELALGQNLMIAYLPWEGYNFEDAIIISERLVYEDLFTSIHIEKYEVELKQTRDGNEELTNVIPNVDDRTLRHLDETGIIYPGAFVEPGDILVGKITPQPDANRIPEGKLIKAVWGERPDEFFDTSLRVSKGVYGRVLNVIVITKENDNNLPPGVIYLIRIFVGQIRKIQLGDKLAGRHGNKGIIAKIVSRQDMPYFPDGTPVDLIFNPHGIPSRMNVGQIYECILGLAAFNLKQRFKVLPFDERFGNQASRIFVTNKLEQAAHKTKKDWLFNSFSPGKFEMRHGHTGKIFDNPIFSGNAYILKLIHLVEEKIHARSTGPYSLITQQPLGGKSQQGGQRFGEMEVWALEAYGAAYTLQELLVTKSDDLHGRNEIFTAIIRGEKLPRPGIPESLRVIIRELQAIGIDIAAYRFTTINSINFDLSEVNIVESFEDILKELFKPDEEDFESDLSFKDLFLDSNF